jgi:competence protein ComEA
MSRDANNDEVPRRRILLRAADQATVAACLSLGLLAMAAWWVAQGGHRGDLIEIDRAEPLEPRFLVDINTADWPELTLLPRIGETLAKRIVASRESDGMFIDNGDLLRVNGIGPRTLEGIRPYLVPMPDAQNVAGR